MKDSKLLRTSKQNKKEGKKHFCSKALKRVISKTGMTSASISLALVMLVSSLPVISFSVSAANNNSQTKYADINAYQNARIAEIQKGIFAYPTTTDNQTSYNATLGIGSPVIGTYEPSMSRWSVIRGNPYFDWKYKENLADVPTWDGVQNYDLSNDTDFAALKFKKTKTGTVATAANLPVVKMQYGSSPETSFKVFNIENPNQLRYALEYLTVHYEADDNFIINITSDLDMGGYNVNESTPAHTLLTDVDENYHNTATKITNYDWQSIDWQVNTNNKRNKLEKRIVYIEGNGHTMFNLRSSDNGLIENANTNIIVKNFCISNSMVVRACKDYHVSSNDPTTLLIGHTTRNTYMSLYNVHTKDSYVQNWGGAYVSGLIGRKVKSAGTFIQNCSTSNLVLIGGSHVGGMTGNLQAWAQENANIQTKSPANYKDPLEGRSPEEIIFSNRIPTTAVTSATEEGLSKLQFPTLLENSYSVDCELFSLGNDSGGLVSCGIGIVAKNCYTNNNIYSDTNTSGFIGRVSSRPGIFAMKDDNPVNSDADTSNDKYRITNYFESCYSSGLVEGRNAMGGFVGYVQSLRNIPQSYTINPNMDNEKFEEDRTSSAYTYKKTFTKEQDGLGDNSGSTIFYNCYSSSSVGMDYAGRYCGGFTGMDQGYTMSTQVNIEGVTTKINGTGYFNCYAVGEVGNILSVTESGEAAQLEKNYLNNNEGVDNTDILPYYPTGGFIGVLCPDRWWVAAAGEYKKQAYAYFTPGSDAEKSADFLHDSSGALKDMPQYQLYKNRYGYFKNCFYDMQTTAMREMAIGIAGGENAYAPQSATDGPYASNYLDNNVKFTFTTSGNGIAYQEDIDAARRGEVSNVDTSKKHIANFSVAGVVGLYTTTAEEKGICGLTDFPIEADNFNKDIQTNNSGFKMKMDNCPLTLKNNSWQCDHWRYEHGYYPQLTVFSNVQGEDNNKTTTDDDIKDSVFYIKSSSFSGDAVPNNSELLKEGTLSGFKSCQGNEFKNMTMVLRAYRYSQASTAAIILNNYNFIMDAATGSVRGDNDWAVAQPSNKMEFNDETGYWQVGYEGLNGGQYEFKVQANDSMTYNYGETKFDDPINCKLNVPYDGVDVVIRFKFDQLFSNDFQILADIYDENGFEYDSVTKQYTGKILRTEPLGGRNNEIKYSVIGSFTGSWTEDYFLTATDNSNKLFEREIVFTENDIKDAEGNFIKQEFKIRGNQDWNVANFGYDGVSDGTNMSFILTKPETIKITFSKDTHKCELFIKRNDDWVSADDESMSEICLESHIADNTVYDYNTFTVVSDKTDITSKRWSDAQTISDKKEIAPLGKMSTVDGKIYTYTASNVHTGKNYQIRVLPFDELQSWALDNADNNFFYIEKSADNAPDDETCTLVITYDSDTKEVSYKATTDSAAELTVNNNILTNKYVVAGDEKITGYHWLGSDKTKIPAADPDSGPNEQEISDYISKAIEKGEMQSKDDTGVELYTWKSETIPKGTYSFKIFADGDIDLGFGEHGGTNNISFTLKSDSAITVTFNAANHLTSITCDDPNVLEIKRYVVTGTENLMGNGQVWNLYNGIMSYDINTGLYEYVISKAVENEAPQKISSGQNYAFKVIEYGIDSGSNISFYLKKDAYIKVTYDPITAVTDFKTYSDIECNTLLSDAAESVHIESYSVIGEKGLTGYTWLGLQDNGQPYEGAEKQKKEEEASIAGKMDPKRVNTPEGQKTIYTKTFENVEVGTNGNFKSYAFKVAANGNWDSGISYGNGDGNFIITLSNPNTNAHEGDPNYNSCNVTITFDPSAVGNEISVETRPDGYIMGEIDTKDFVWYVVGDQGLASYSESFRGPDTTYDTVRDITQTVNFTNGSDTVEKGIAWSLDQEFNRDEGYITKFGGEESGANLDSGFTLNYQVDGKKVKTTFDEDVIDLDTKVDFGSALVRESNPVPSDDDGIEASLESYLNLDNLLSSTWQTPSKYIDFPITYTSERFMPGKQFLSVSAYGIGTSEDFNRWKIIRVLYDQFVLRGDDLDKKAKSLLLLIDADELTQANPSGTKIQQLVSYLTTMKANDREQYDHYTQGFDFVTRYEQWNLLHNKLKEYKAAYSEQFVNAPGSEEDGTDVIPLDAPYVNISKVSVIGTRLVRLIPKGYIEAGNDATVTVIDTMDKNEEKRQNVVVYDRENSTSDVRVELEGGDIGTETFSYYNFALMAGYAITDKIGLGIYDNYSNQNVKNNNSRGIIPFSTTRRNEDDSSERNYGKYYAMTSAFCETSEYNDETSVDAEGKVTRNPKLDVGSLVSQQLIGDSNEVAVDNGSGGTTTRKGQTIVKIYKVLNKGKSTESERIVLTKMSTSEDSGSESNTNYLKWTGQKKFESTDNGDYRVKFYWAMNDGRYFTDTKDVNILANMSGITKKVSKSFDDATYNDKTNELTYTLKYTNSVSAQPVTFAILDILPFVGDARINPDMKDTTGEIVTVDDDTTKLEGDGRTDPEFQVTKLEITRSGNENTKKAEIKGVYLSSQENVRDLLYEDATEPDGSPKFDESGNQEKVVSEHSASNLGVYVAPDNIDEYAESSDPVKQNYIKNIGTIIDTSQYGWNKLSRGPAGSNTGSDGVYNISPVDGENVKAIAVTGIQLASADSVSVAITVKYNGNPNDDLFNNAYFFSAFSGKWSETKQLVDEYKWDDGYSNNVRTTIVGRDLSGSVWLDSNVNGVWDNDEASISGVKVDLVKYDKDPSSGELVKAENNPVATTFTSSSGGYSFNDKELAEGNYKVEFVSPDGGKVTLNYKDAPSVEKDYSQLLISKILSQSNGVDNNIAHISSDNTADSSKKYYIDQEFPNAADIFTYSYSDTVNVVKDNFVYTKSKQNLALTDAYGKITIKKYSDNDLNNPMSGIKFKLEYLDDGKEWKLLTYNSNGFIDNVNPAPEHNDGIFETNSDGIIELNNLYQTTYRITEINTDDDHNPLLRPIEINIPYSEESGKKNNIISVDEGNPSYSEDGVDYFREITVTLSNTTKINDYLPLTGATEGFNILIPIIGFIIVAAGVGIILYALKKRKARNNAR